MTDAALQQLRFPIGKFSKPAEFTDELTAQNIQAITDLPQRMRAAVEGLTDEQLDTPYREGGWTVRQVVHHTADSHMNAYTRFRWALTEDEPVIKAYYEPAWAKLEDAKHAPVDSSLGLLDNLHIRWTTLLNALSNNDLERGFLHPENKYRYSLHEALGLYAWHGAHHTAHITSLRERMGW